MLAINDAIPNLMVARSHAFSKGVRYFDDISLTLLSGP